MVERSVDNREAVGSTPTSGTRIDGCVVRVLSGKGRGPEHRGAINASEDMVSNLLRKE